MVWGNSAGDTIFHYSEILYYNVWGDTDPASAGSSVMVNTDCAGGTPSSVSYSGFAVEPNGLGGLLTLVPPGGGATTEDPFFSATSGTSVSVPLPDVSALPGIGGVYPGYTAFIQVTCTVPGSPVGIAPAYLSVNVGPSGGGGGTPPPPPLADFDSTLVGRDPGNPPGAFTPGLYAVQFASTVLDPALPSGPFTYVWNFGDGDGITSTTAASPEHEYAHAGSFPVSLTVSDGDGTSTPWLETVVLANQPPVVHFHLTTQSGTLCGGPILTVDASNSTDDSRIVSYRVALFAPSAEVASFDGPVGSFGCGQIVRNTAYTVLVAVTDDDGATSTAAVPYYLSGLALPPPPVPPGSAFMGTPPGNPPPPNGPPPVTGPVIGTVTSISNKNPSVDNGFPANQPTGSLGLEVYRDGAWYQAPPNLELQVGDWLRTSSNTLVTIQLTVGGVVEVNGGSEVGVINDGSVAGSESGTGSLGFYEEMGSMWANVSKRTEPLEINTASGGYMTIRG